jgi:hypothetical protein
VLTRVAYLGSAKEYKQLAAALPEDDGLLDVKLADLADHWVRGEPQPWLNADGLTLNPARPEYRPKGDSFLIGFADESQLPKHDLSGRARSQPAAGALTP